MMQGTLCYMHAMREIALRKGIGHYENTVVITSLPKSQSAASCLFSSKSDFMFGFMLRIPAQSHTCRVSFFVDYHRHVKIISYKKIKQQAAYVDFRRNDCHRMINLTYSSVISRLGISV